MVYAVGNSKIPKDSEDTRTFAHDKTSNSSNSPPTGPAQQLSTAAQSADMTGGLTELRAELDGVFDEVTELGQQVSILINEVRTLPTLRNLLQERGTQHSEQLEQLRDEWVSKIKALEDNAISLHQLLKRQLSAAQSELSNTEQQLNKLTETVLESKKSISALDKAVSQLTDRIDSVERDCVSSVTELAVIKNKIERQPTGKIVEVKTHEYKEYWSQKGLVKPYLHSRDLILGNRWVDLAEPED